MSIEELSLIYLVIPKIFQKKSLTSCNFRYITPVVEFRPILTGFMNWRFSMNLQNNVFISIMGGIGWGLCLKDLCRHVTDKFTQSNLRKNLSTVAFSETTLYGKVLISRIRVLVARQVYSVVVKRPWGVPLMLDYYRVCYNSSS